MAETVVPVVAESSVEGDQAYVFAPAAVRDTDWPLQRIGATGLINITGVETTTTVALVEAEQLFESIIDNV